MCAGLIMIIEVSRCERDKLDNRFMIGRDTPPARVEHQLVAYKKADAWSIVPA